LAYWQEDEGLRFYTAARDGLRPPHWSKPWLKLSSHLQLSKAAPFLTTGLNSHIGVSGVDPEEGQQTHQRQPFPSYLHEVLRYFFLAKLL